MRRRRSPRFFSVSRATGITIYLENHRGLEHAEQMAGMSLREQPNFTIGRTSLTFLGPS